jgi:hypothetical protein
MTSFFPVLVEVEHVKPCGQTHCGFALCLVGILDGVEAEKYLLFCRGDMSLSIDPLQKTLWRCVRRFLPQFLPVVQGAISNSSSDQPEQAGMSLVKNAEGNFFIPA